jgi:hypothetical protein
MPKPEAKKKISLFDDNETNNVNQKININNQTNSVKAPSFLFEGIDTTQKAEIKPQQNPNPIITNPPIENQKMAEKKKNLAMIFEDEEKQQNNPPIQPQPQPQPQPQMAPLNTQPQPQIQQQIQQNQPQQQKKINLFDNTNTDTQPVKKKVSLFDNIETNKNQINNNINQKNNEEEIKTKLTNDSVKKTGINKMASRFENMVEEKKKKKIEKVSMFLRYLTIKNQILLQKFQICKML